MSRSKRSGSVLSRLAKLAGGVLLGLYLSAPAYAFTPSDSPLLSAGSVAPNVMLLVDDSGSMNNLIWASGYNPNATPLQVYNCYSYSNCNSVVALDMTSDNQFIGNFYPGPCSSDYDGFKIGTSNNVYCLKLPDPVGGGNTRISNKYLAYLIGQMTGLTKDYTDGTIPKDYRINVARTVSSSLVSSNRNLRIGLATFNAPRNNDSGPGGYIARSVSDLTPVSGSTTQAQADANYNALLSSISGLSAIANTPLAETYYEITRYFRGMTPYYNSTPTTYTSPIQYRCQKNYGVVITDGLPTYDRTFPSNDPLGGSNLPNWDGRNNDGNNLSGDGEGDTLYLDDIAKFAYDIDMRSSGTDLAGKSWDSQQNIATYTVGFTAANQMLADAANYGHGTYYQATDGAGLNAALSAALNDITSRAGAGGGGAASSSDFRASTLYFKSSYDPTDWRGTINAYGFGTDGSTNTNPNWSSDDTIQPGAKNTATFQSWNTLTNAAITLSYLNFSLPQQVALGASLPLGISGSDLVEWSKGTNKTGLKNRTVLLGDIVNSRLVYASSTDRTASDMVGDTSYTAFLDGKASSTGMSPRLLVNANDGFFNVIEPNTGKRLYAYMPSSVLSNLHYVADPAYINGTSHKFLADGQISVVDAKLNNSWKTVAVGGVGAGGKTFYAVQLYDASAGNAINALWEISASLTAFSDLGYAYAKPEVARYGTNGRWAAFIPNGYGSTSGMAALYVVDMQDGSLLAKIPVDTSGNNGLSSVKLRVNAQSVVQYAYGGDLKGQMWKFDLTDASPSNWKVAFNKTPLFTASGGANQPITAQPVIGNLPGQGKLIYFGTGKLSETADKTTTARQAFYAVLDTDGSSAGYTESNLVAQTINAPAAGTSTFTSSQNSVDYATKKGFYFSLVINNVLTGERVLYPALLTFGRLIFTTAIVDTSDPCSSSGSGRLMDVDAVTGAMLSYPVLDTNGDRKINAGDQIVSGMTFSGGLPNVAGFVRNADGSQVILGPNGSPTELGGVNNRRIMWRQLQ
ncbi:pilus assembly protein [Pseudomonas gingeri]|uniref:pilus assembly protein n=1 Tax=Pseudomonas gingeri TaxID=117681 RepID=UPI00159F8CC7|nr:PilC/PilY family type IV pilus protein [Pseudomonas gingeri]NWD09285.1 pilus assembly protein [Pseudomonas gingeri]NWE32062.1 pilus assembly protein [Pseudomonas gingeri]NWE58720.1 pilus assembly protein [Pseudomonas gingeri]NWF01263.1 pilus assembly protein [Pseudomonas gingeri]